jgi:hypothetical protein
VLLYMPGRRLVQQLLPLALGASGIWVAQGCWDTGSGFKARADSSSGARVPATGSKAGAAECAVAQLPAGAGTVQPDGPLPALIARLGLGGNEFANVRPVDAVEVDLTVQVYACTCIGGQSSSACRLFALAPACTTSASLCHTMYLTMTQNEFQTCTP